jgi:hypothetical protein
MTVSACPVIHVFFDKYFYQYYTYPSHTHLIKYKNVEILRKILFKKNVDNRGRGSRGEKKIFPRDARIGQYKHRIRPR